MWKQLTIDDLRLILSEDETKQLSSYSLDSELTTVINSTIDIIADAWRGAFLAKGYAVDQRDHYIPSSYQYYVLVHARHAVWTRFPNSESIALDERRKDEYDEAIKLLADPFIGTDPVDDEHKPKDDSVGAAAAGIFVPNMRFPQWYLRTEAQTLQLSNYF